MKKRFVQIIALLLVVASLAACGGKADSGNASASSNEPYAPVSFPLAEQVTLTALTHAPSFASGEFNDRPIVKRMEESTNVHIDWTVYVDDQFGEKKQLAMTKKDLPDMVFDAQMSQYDLLRYSKDGTIIAGRRSDR